MNQKYCGKEKKYSILSKEVKHAPNGLFSSDIDYQYIKCDPKEKQGIF